MKSIRIGAALLFFCHLSASAETITCENSDHSMHLNVKVVRTSEPSLNLKNLYAVTKDKEGRPLAYNTVALTRHSKDKISYRDIFDRRSFTLVLDSNVAEGDKIPGDLSLNVGATFERHFTNLSCAITGPTLVPLEPCLEDQASLDTELLKIAKFGTANQLESLLSCGANPNVADAVGCTPIQYVCDLSCGYDPTSLEAPNSSSRGSLVLEPLLEALGRSGVDVNARYLRDGQSPLMKLAQYGQIQGVRTLLSLKADVNLQDLRGNTVLMSAVDRGNEPLVRALLSARPNLAVKNKDGKTARDIAVEKGLDDLAALLAQKVPVTNVTGYPDGSCSPVMIHLSRNKEIEVVLLADSDMFLLTAPDLGIELMSMPNEPAKQKITPTKTGTFPFTCGVHGSSKQTQGSFMIM